MSHSRKPVSAKDYCQYLLSTQGNYTLTHYAEQAGWLSHDKVNRFLREVYLPPRRLWEEVKGHIVPGEQGFIVFDDTVLNKRFAREIEGVRSQYSGNAHAVIRGIGVVTCLYVNAETQQFWAIDWRIFDPDKDGKSKNDHVREMLHNLHHHKKLPYQTVLMDTWYATQELMLMIEGLGKFYYCPLKGNRLVDDSRKAKPYRPVRELEWSDRERKEGKIIKIKNFPRDHKVRLFRVPVSSNRTDNVVTNDPSCSTTDAVRKTCAVRWHIEELHRELKQITGIERCQCRLNRIQRNHIACAFLVWNRLKNLAYQTAKTVYQLKIQPLKSFLARELASPTIRFA